MRRARLAHDLADGLRRAALAFGIVFSWGILGMMLELSAGAPPEDLGRASALAPWLRASLPFHLLLLVPASAAFILRRRHAACASALFLLLWACDMAVRRPAGEHGHQLTLITLFVYAVMTAWGGPGKPAERLAWECCRVVVGLLYAVSGLVKLWQSGPGWVHPDHLETITMTAVLSATGWQRALRLALVEHPWVLSAGGVLTLLIECSGWLLLWRSARPYYLAALLLLNLTTYAGVGVLFYPYVVPLLPLLLPLEVWGLKAARALAARRRARRRGSPRR